MTRPEIDAAIDALPQPVKDELNRRTWLVATMFGADRSCRGCDKVVRKIANGRDEGHACFCRNERRPL